MRRSVATQSAFGGEFVGLLRGGEQERLPAFLDGSAGKGRQAVFDHGAAMPTEHLGQGVLALGEGAQRFVLQFRIDDFTPFDVEVTVAELGFGIGDLQSGGRAGEAFELQHVDEAQLPEGGGEVGGLMAGGVFLGVMEEVARGVAQGTGRERFSEEMFDAEGAGALLELGLGIGGEHDEIGGGVFAEDFGDEIEAAAIREVDIEHEQAEIVEAHEEAGLVAGLSAHDAATGQRLFHDAADQEAANDAVFDDENGFCGVHKKSGCLQG
jgi:hypothetical protein